MQVTSSQRFYTLPLPPNALIGRGRELETVATQLLSSEVRLLTLLGTAGVGKTRLAISVAHDVHSNFKHGVFFVDLSGIKEAKLVIPTLTQTLGVQLLGKKSPLETLLTYLKDRQVLLVLDNFEQVVQAAKQLVDVLEVCPDVKCLVTSRVRLQLRWGHTVTITPLELPMSFATDLDLLSKTPAVALFLERVRFTFPTFTLTANNASSVVKLCQLLDGLPLALELAAAHAHVLSPEAMIARWKDHLSWLGWKASDLPSRHRTLSEAIAWSYTLLSKQEQKLFRQLGVFANGWTLEAAEAVTGHKDTLADLTTLINASLVKVVHGDNGQTRFYLLESLRDYACGQLKAAGEGGQTQHSHALYFAELAQRAAPGVKGEEQLEWFHLLGQERDNFRAALAWASEHERDMFLNLFGNLAYFWWTRGHLHEGQQWLEKALRHSAKTSAAMRLHVLEAAGLLTGTLGEYDAAARHLEEALKLAESFNDADKVMGILNYLMLVSWLSGKYKNLAIFTKQLGRWRDDASNWNVAFALHCLGLIASEEGKPATSYLEESLALFRQTKDFYRAVAVLSTLAVVSYDQHDTERARTFAKEALEAGRTLGNQRTIAFASDVVLFILEGKESPLALATYLGAVDGLRSRISFQRPPKMNEHYEALATKLRIKLGEESYRSAWTAGQTMTLEHLVTELLKLFETPTSKNPLSSREQEILNLVAKGLSNKQMAKVLEIAPSTVNFHLTSLFNKLGVNSRARAVAIAVERGLFGGDEK
jgi:predicted ATPase/DNA-binding CsgD family transcriptional regulator